MRRGKLHGKKWARALIAIKYWMKIDRQAPLKRLYFVDVVSFFSEEIWFPLLVSARLAHHQIPSSFLCPIFTFRCTKVMILSFSGVMLLQSRK